MWISENTCALNKSERGDADCEREAARKCKKGEIKKDKIKKGEIKKVPECVALLQGTRQ